MEKSKQLVKTTSMYFIGTFGSKLLIFFLLPLYSKYLSTDAFGMVNLLTNFVPLIGPIFTLQVTDCVFRFLCDTKEEEIQKKYITNSFFLFLMGMIVFLILYLPLAIAFEFEFRYLFLFYFVFNYFGIYMQQLLRGMHKNTDYVITGVISTLVNVLVNIFLVSIIFEKTVMLAVIISSITVIIYSLVKAKFFKYISLKLLDKKVLKEMLSYTLPLIPNQISWWINGTLGLYFLKYFINEEAVGVVTFANKFPSLITTLNSIFLLAWTEYTIVGYNDDGIAKFFSNILEKFTKLVIIVSALLLPMIKIYFEYFISEEYAQSLNLVPILMISMIFNAVATFKGTLYTASKKTKGALTTTAIAAIVNMISAIILIQKFGVYGYAFSNVIGNIIFYLARIESINKIMKIEEHYTKYILPTVLFTVSIFAVYKLDIIYNIILEIIMIIILLTAYKKEINEVFSQLRKNILRNKV